jgi:hypothetical protein
MIGESPIRAEARTRFADAVAAKGRLWRDTADSIRDGRYGNHWTEAAIDAVEATLRNPELSEPDE